MEEMPWTKQLNAVVMRIEQGEIVEATVRELLGWFNSQRRGALVVNWIRRELGKRNLVTIPDFEYEWIDGPVSFILKVPAPQTTSTTSTTTTANPNDLNECVAATSEILVVGGAVQDPAYRIGKLEAANRPPTSIKPDAPLNEAVTVMLKENFSQLPVMTSPRDVKGAVSWRTIAGRLALGITCETVRDCMDRSVEIVEADTSLFRVIEIIAEHGFVLVRNSDKTISGIVTETDLGNSFYQLGRPFLLLSEIENHIRRIIDGKFTIDELKAARNPNDSEREITDVSDLSFGDYVHLLQNPDKWNKVGLAIDRSTFTKTLERVNVIRNDVMHFDPDGIGNDALEELRKTAKFLQELREISGGTNV